MRAKTILIYGLSFFIPPFMTLVLGNLAIVQDVMIPREAQPVEAMPAPPSPEPGKPAIAFVVSNAGTQITDLLAPYEILGRTQAFNLFTVALRREAAPLTGSLGLIPDYTIQDAPQPDVIVIPPHLDTPPPELLDWIRRRATEARWVVSVCEGARVLAEAGLLQGKRATSHFITLDDLRAKYGGVEFVSDQRIVEDGKIITTAGVTASIDGAYHLIERLLGPGAVKRDWVPADEVARPGFWHYTRMLFNGGYDWVRRNGGVLIYPGVPETAVAAAFDTFPRTLNHRLVSIAIRREAIETAHGLILVPTLALRDAPTFDFVLVPGEGKGVIGRPEIGQWVQEWDVPLRSGWSGQTADQAFPGALSLLSADEDPFLAETVARFIEFPWEPPSGGGGSGFPLPFGLLVRPILLGLIGVVAVALFRRREERRRTPSPGA